MIIAVYDSMTGMGKRFADKLSIHTVDIRHYEYTEGDQILLITRNQGYGEITQPTKSFLDQYAEYVIGVAVSGNKNWGKNFGRAGDLIQEEYNIPLLLKFEGSGFDSDVEKIKEVIGEKNEE